MYPSPMADNGYDISDYYGISSDFGTMATSMNSLKKQKRNIKVILDLVFQTIMVFLAILVQWQTSMNSLKKQNET